MIERDEAVALFERRRDAWLAEDIDAYLGLFAEDVVLQTPVGEPVHGHDEYAALVRRAYRYARPVSFEFHAIAVHADTVLAEWTIELEVRADGRRVRYRGMSRCELRDGRIASWREFYDPSDLAPTDGRAHDVAEPPGRGGR